MTALCSDLSNRFSNTRAPGRAVKGARGRGSSSCSRGNEACVPAWKIVIRRDCFPPSGVLGELLQLQGLGVIACSRVEACAHLCRLCRAGGRVSSSVATAETNAVQHVLQLG